MPRTGPPGHTPRFTAYSARFPEGADAFVFAQYACQAPSWAVADDGATRLATLFTEPDGPDLVDRGSFTDTAGTHNVVWLAYWYDPEAHRRWRESAAVRSTWERLPDSSFVGHWREECIVPIKRTETLHTHRREDYPTSGLSQSGALELQDTQTHDYWGAARERIAASATDPLEPNLPRFAPQSMATRGRRVRIDVPGNVALIRTAQDWSTSAVFRDRYLADVNPTKDRGVHFLATHPESGCIAARNLIEEAADGTTLDRASTVAWFTSLEALMAWCRSHPTHLDIYASFFQMVADGDAPLDVAFWHEVSVLPQGSVTAEYVNCDPRTGFLPLGTHQHSTAI